MPHDMARYAPLASPPTAAATAGEARAAAGAADREGMYARAVNEVVRATGLSPRLADVIVFRVLKAWETPSEAIRTCTRECTELFEDENLVVRGAATDFGKSWSQQIARILQEGAQNGP